MRLLERLRIIPRQEARVLNTELAGAVVDKLLSDLRSGFTIEENREDEEDEGEEGEKKFEVVLRGNGRFYKVLETYSVPTYSYISVQEHKSLKRILEDPIAIGERRIWFRYWLDPHIKNGLDFYSGRQQINYAPDFGWLFFRDKQRSLREILDFFDCVMRSRVDESSTQELFKRRESRHKSDIEKGIMRVRWPKFDTSKTEIADPSSRGGSGRLQELRR